MQELHYLNTHYIIGNIDHCNDLYDPFNHKMTICLAHCISRKGLIKGIRDPNSVGNMIFLDCGPAIDQVNQINRITLMMSIALGQENESSFEILSRTPFFGVPFIG